MKRNHCTAICASLGMLILIFDTRTALSGATEGIDLCLKTVIPSLLPFFFLSILVTGSISASRIGFLAPVCKFLRLPLNAAPILAVGFLGGYPVGAQCIADAVRQGHISRENGRRMLAFSSNAGPAFLFGIGSRIFADISMCWALWIIHILSALLVGILTPGEAEECKVCQHEKSADLTNTLRQCIRTMSMVCGWVILFRVMLTFCQRWFLWLLPDWAQILFCGLLELANGCCGLVRIESEQLRFLLFSVMLGFGGLCVTMQTLGVTQGMDTSRYLPGKITQALLSGVMATLFISREMAPLSFLLLAAICGGYSFLCRKGQKMLAFRKPALYNKEKLHTR